MVHVPGKGCSACTAYFLGGQVDCAFGSAPPSMAAHIQSGKLKVLAVTGKNRSPSLPQVPTTAKTGLPDVNAMSWLALFAPTKTTAEVVRKLEANVRNMIAVQKKHWIKVLMWTLKIAKR